MPKIIGKGKAEEENKRVVIVIENIEVWLYQDSIVMQDLTAGYDSRPIEISPQAICYIIQEYQKHFQLTATVGGDWKGFIGTNDGS